MKRVPKESDNQFRLSYENIITEYIPLSYVPEVLEMACFCFFCFLFFCFFVFFTSNLSNRERCMFTNVQFVSQL